MRKKGFTLVELMGVIMILGVIALIAIPVIDRQLKDSKKDLSQTQKENIKDAAQLWGAKNIYNLPESSKSCYIKYSDLVNEGYLKEELKDPNTNVEFSDDTVSIKVEKDANHSKYSYDVLIGSSGTTPYCTDKYSYNNIVKNGGFEYTRILGKIGSEEFQWNYNQNYINPVFDDSNAYDGKYSLKIINEFTSTTTGTVRIYQEIPTSINHIYYFSTFVKTNFSDLSTSSPTLIYVIFSPADTSWSWLVSSSNSSSNDVWTKCSLIYKGNTSYNSLYATVGERNSNTGIVKNDYFNVDDIMVVDLTETFGAGNEPDKDWCDENLNYVEYGDTAYIHYTKDS